MAKAAEWGFSERIAQDRRISLMAVAEFDQVIGAILNEMSITGYVFAWGQKAELRECRRPEFELAVSKGTFDLFFNSPAGYRAQYYVDSELGIEQNARLIQSVLPKLVAHAEQHPQRGISVAEIDDSLRFRSSKVWVQESDEDAVFGDELVVDITVDRWVREAKVAFYGSGSNEQRHKAVRGVLAPTGTILEVKGGWLQKDRTERLDPAKVTRAVDISQYGFS